MHWIFTEISTNYSIQRNFSALRLSKIRVKLLWNPAKLVESLYKPKSWINWCNCTAMLWNGLHLRNLLWIYDLIKINLAPECLISESSANKGEATQTWNTKPCCYLRTYVVFSENDFHIEIPQFSIRRTQLNEIDFLCVVCVYIIISLQVIIFIIWHARQRSSVRASVRRVYTLLRTIWILNLFVAAFLLTSHWLNN